MGGRSTWRATGRAGSPGPTSSVSTPRLIPSPWSTGRAAGTVSPAARSRPPAGSWAGQGSTISLRCGKRSFRRHLMFQGCGTAMVTPFRSDLSLDEEALRRLIRRQIESGIHFLVPCGTTGENPTLSKAEQRRVVEITLEEAKGKVPVLAGAGGYDTRGVAEMAREYEAME